MTYRPFYLNPYGWHNAPFRELPEKELRFEPSLNTEYFIRRNAQAEANRTGKPHVVIQNPTTLHFTSLERWEPQREHLEACGNVVMDTLYPEETPTDG